MSEPKDFGPAFHRAGQCFMYLVWLESRLADFLCIKDAQKRNDQASLREYEEMQSAGHPSISYERQVSKWSRQPLGAVLDEFQGEWPEYESDSRVSYAFKIVRIHRNAFAHAYMGSRSRLVFVPNEGTKKLIRDTGLDIGKLTQGNPDFALLLPCYHAPFLVSFYDNIKTIDFVCFRHVAEELGVEYTDTLADPHWPATQGIDPVTLRPELGRRRP